jgi:hypothetical protein
MLYMKMDTYCQDCPNALSDCTCIRCHKTFCGTCMDKQHVVCIECAAYSYDGTGCSDDCKCPLRIANNPCAAEKCINARKWICKDCNKKFCDNCMDRTHMLCWTCDDALCDRNKCTPHSCPYYCSCDNFLGN